MLTLKPGVCRQELRVAIQKSKAFGNPSYFPTPQADTARLELPNRAADNPATRGRIRLHQDRFAVHTREGAKFTDRPDHNFRLTTAFKLERVPPPGFLAAHAILLCLHAPGSKTWALDFVPTGFIKNAPESTTLTSKSSLPCHLLRQQRYEDRPLGQLGRLPLCRICPTPTSI